jgi:hypothetical protein
MVLKAANLGKLDHLPAALLMYRPSLRDILFQRKMRAIFVIIVKISPEDSP